MPSVDEVLEIFRREKNLLAANQWFVSPPRSMRWWAGLKDREEIIISVILAQQSRWEGVAKTLSGIGERGGVAFLVEADARCVANAIKTLNFYRTKARRVKHVAKLLQAHGVDGFLGIMRGVEGIGAESADTLDLFVGNREVMPTTVYTERVMERVFAKRVEFERLEEYKLFYAGATTVGRVFCHRTPACEECVLNAVCLHGLRALGREGNRGG